MAVTKVKLPDPWGRQPGESTEAFAAFVIYRDSQPKIGAAKVGETCGKNPSLTERWCTKFRWKERREAWEDEQDRLTRETLVKGVTAMRKKHADIATAILVKAAKALTQLPAEEMTMTDIARAVDVAAKLERLSRGEATERTEGNNTTTVNGKVTVANDPYEELTTDELRKLARLAADDKQT